MPRIAVLADIHANVPAMQAVLDDIDAQTFDEVLVCGDLVGRGPSGSAIVQMVRRRGWRSVRGNHEDYMLNFRRREVPQAWLTAPEWRAARWMAAELSEADVSFIDELPFTLTSDAEPTIRLFHGSPRSHSEGLGKWTSSDTLRYHLESIEEQVLVVAHTHRPGQWRLDEGFIVNVGSVGLPFDGDPRAQYAVLTVTDGEVEAAIRRVDYDRRKTLRAFEDSGFLEAGGATSVLLTHEVEHARPHLVPFLKWCESRGLVPLREHVDEFLASYDPNMSMAELAARWGLK